uniref:Uncharacterized protein n=1 Tax=Cucumis sativus TaxID=3659 RepID=A0A0A0K157_CUCSA
MVGVVKITKFLGNTEWVMRCIVWLETGGRDIPMDYSRFDDNVKAFIEEEAEVSSDAAITGDEDDKITSLFDNETSRLDMMPIYSFNNKNGKCLEKLIIWKEDNFGMRVIKNYDGCAYYEENATLNGLPLQPRLRSILQDWYLSCASEVMVAVCQLG